MTEIVGFFHAGITVDDMDVSLPFYRDGLGLEVFWDVVKDDAFIQEVVGVEFSTLRNVMLRLPGGGFVELLEYRGVPHEPAAGSASRPGSGHLCLEVTDIDSLVARARTYGGRTVSGEVVTVPGGERGGSRLVYLRDPDGWLIELYQFAKGSAADLQAPS